MPRWTNRSQQAQFDMHSRRKHFAGSPDVVMTAVTYLRASKITVATKAQMLRALPKVRSAAR